MISGPMPSPYATVMGVDAMVIFSKKMGWKGGFELAP
jgi:hypothetical protein